MTGAILTPSAARAQAIPAAEASPISTGFTLPTVGGSLNWSVTGSDSISWGYYTQNGASNFGTISGNLAYLSASHYHPFSMVLSAGRSFSNGNYPAYTFVSFGLSQVITEGRWNIVLSDGLSYVPGTPIPGLSGVVGVGDVGVAPIQTGPNTGQGLLTNYSPEINNNGGASVTRDLTGKTAINASGSYTILRFVGGGSQSSGVLGLQSDSVTGSVGMTHRLNARTVIGGNYAYSSYIFLNNLASNVPEPNFASQTATFTLTHQFTRKLDLTLAAGPQFTQLSGSSNGVASTPYGNVQLDYTARLAHFSLGYVRSTNSGFGVIGGSLSDSVNLSAGRSLGRVWNASANVAYSHTANLPVTGVLPYDFQTVIATVQAARSVGRNMSVFASYTAEHQSQSTSSAVINQFNGLNQIVSFGITYSPASKQMGRP